MVLPLAFGWRDLLFANWPVEAETLSAHLPQAFAVEEYDGTGWLSVVPFVNVEVRPRGLPAWAGVDLPELNLRTYVTVDGVPGAYFFSLDADGILAVLGARVTHHLPYYYARMRVEREGDRVRFRSRRRHPGARPARYSATYRPVGDAFVPEPGSLAEFLTERRRLFTQDATGAIRHTDVDHDRWTLYPAEASTSEDTLFSANGFRRPSTDPTVYYSPGLDVVTSGSQRWRPGEETE